MILKLIDTINRGIKPYAVPSPERCRGQQIKKPLDAIVLEKIY